LIGVELRRCRVHWWLPWLREEEKPWGEALGRRDGRGEINIPE